jgi:hypothetical protein
MHRVSWILIATVLARAPLAAQATDSALTLPPAPAPAPTPTPDQQKYLDGLRTAGRGVAQLKDGIDRVGRNRADTAQLRMAGQRLGGLCGSAGSFLRQGRARMSHAVYADSARTLARRLNQQVDSLIAFLPTCQREGGKKPTATAATLVARLRSYEGALQKFREVAVLAPAQPTTPTP